MTSPPPPWGPPPQYGQPKHPPPQYGQPQPQYGHQWGSPPPQQPWPPGPPPNNNRAMWLWGGGIALLVAIVVAVVVLIVVNTGSDEPQAQRQSNPTVTVDESLTDLLIDDSDVDYTVLDISDAMQDADLGPTGTADPPECDSSDKTQLDSAVGAAVTDDATGATSIVMLSRSEGLEVVREIEDWLGRCDTFTVEVEGVTATATMRTLDPPDTDADAQVGFEMTTSGVQDGVDVTMMLTGYVAEVDDLAVLAMSIGGGEAGTGSGLDVDPALLDEIFEAQIAKVR